MTSQRGIANHTVPATTNDCSLYLQSSLSLSDNQIGTNHILMNDCHKQNECSYSSRPTGGNVARECTYSCNCDCVVTNLRSLLNKVCDFKAFLDSHLPGMVAITETWLDSTIPSSVFIDPSAYWCFRKDRIS